ncbi:hypothetical protein CC78DRAFT_574879 [Lojkania enalia]|uniref:Uncharacterized protein n=1 Tax=Lojkania enalia TaxID=147567 RepID=A0A9P4TPW5_9PLEO|nr:hypothetical protein CC78DRAFT_574879 [Didymosphaeria enalia]
MAAPTPRDTWLILQPPSGFIDNEASVEYSEIFLFSLPTWLFNIRVSYQTWKGLRNGVLLVKSHLCDYDRWIWIKDYAIFLEKFPHFYDPRGGR